MNLPPFMPEVLRHPNETLLGVGRLEGLTAQDLLDPRNIACVAACSRKAGFAACLARCLVDGMACDGGIDNCTGV